MDHLPAATANIVASFPLRTAPPDTPYRTQPYLQPVPGPRALLSRTRTSGALGAQWPRAWG